MFLGALNIFLTPTQVHLLIALATAMVPDREYSDFLYLMEFAYFQF